MESSCGLIRRLLQWWIRNNDKKQPLLVANREAEFLDSTTADQWNHVYGVKNPADLGTRAFSYTELMGSDWREGPLWLKDEDWIPHMGQILTDDYQQVDDIFEVATDGEAGAFLGALASKPIYWERFSQFNCLKFMVMRILKMLAKC